MNQDILNWPAISALEDNDLRFFFMTVSNETLLAGLAQGFPNLFHSEPRKFCFPLSQIRRQAIKAWRKNMPLDDVSTIKEAAEYSWEQACRDLSIPLVTLCLGLELERQIEHHDELMFAVGQIVSVLGNRLMIVGTFDCENIIWAVKPDHIDLNS